MKDWDAYVDGVSRCGTSHAAALRSVHLRFEVRIGWLALWCLKRQNDALVCHTAFPCHRAAATVSVRAGQHISASTTCSTCQLC